MFEIYKGKRVFITGASGIKGTWLTSMLLELGAFVKGYSLHPQANPFSHFHLLRNDFEHEYADIRNFDQLQTSIRRFSPDFVFHLAAMPIVRKSYEIPVLTYKTNIIGTVNVLEACRYVDSIRSLCLITTDKVYKDQERNEGYFESDVVGGFDPYSCSKACCELIIDSYRNSFYKEKEIFISSCRAGNIIAGGDYASDRIIPDIVRATIENQDVIIRSPDAVRPFQHVLDCLTGYLLLGEEMYRGVRDLCGAYNFGPDETITILELAIKAQTEWDKITIDVQRNNTLHETKILRLNSDKAKTHLGWRPQYSIDQAISKTVEWYREFHENRNVITYKQIKEYLDALRTIKG